MSENDSVNNKRIAKNTLFLYGRMLLSMLISLYTARVILNTLGESDFGIYNVVGGIIAIFCVLQSLISTGTQRFLTYEMGRKSGIDKLKAVFSTSYSIYLILGGVIVLLGESVGLWFVNKYLVIPDDRMFAANIVYQVSIVSMFVSVIQLPYTAVIMSHERMDIYGYIGIAGPLLRLLLIIILPFLPWDKLIIYSIMILIVSSLTTLFCALFCKKLFIECQTRLHIDKSLGRNLLSFTTWNLLESISNSLSGQGQNILLNMFFGTSVNASRAVAMQVNNAIHGFASNFLIALFPQITKQYAAGNMDDFYKLMIRGAKFSYLILALIMIPVFLNTEFLLELWLKTPPKDSALFCKLIMLSVIIRMVSEPLYTGIQATGNIKSYQVWTSSITLLNLPLCYILFKIGLPSIWAFIIGIIMSVVLVICRMYFINKETKFPLTSYCKVILLECIGVSLLTYCILYIINAKIIIDITSFILMTLLSIIFSCIVFFFVSMNSSERKFILNLIKKRR